MDVHLRDLRFFVAVAEALHFSRAADALHISQPALSKRIGILEGQLRVRLFERDRRSVSLTPAGSALLDHATAILSRWDAGERALAAAATGTVTIGLQTSPGGGVLPRMRALLAQRCPDAELVLRQVGWHDPTAGLEDRSCDAAFVWLPLPRPARFGWSTVSREPIVVALPAAHPLAARDSVAFAEVRDEPFLALPATSPAMRAFWLADAHRDGRPAVIAAEISDTEETYEAVASGIGVCLLGERNIPIFDRAGVTCVLVGDLPQAELVLAWRHDEDPPLRRTLVEVLRAALTDPDGRRA